MMSAKIALRWASILRILWPQAQRTAKIASPPVPLRGQRVSRPSVFMCPISASMALRLRNSFASMGVMPLRMPLINTRVRVTPCPR